MTTEERFATLQKKHEQHKHQQSLQKNRNKDLDAKIELRRKILIGEMFLKHFPLALKFIPGKSSDEDTQIFKPLDNFMESLSQCQQSYQILEDTLLLSQQH